jgi:hypothetical protein
MICKRCVNGGQFNAAANSYAEQGETEIEGNLRDRARADHLQCEGGGCVCQHFVGAPLSDPSQAYEAGAD